MGFLLKIVEGPNRGAEIALVEGVAVTLGKGDDCDIVLADATLPETPLSVEASADGVAVNGETVQSFHVKTFGATSFAVGPADAQWGELEWPKADVPEKPEKPDSPEKPVAAEKPESREAPAEPEKKRRRGCFGCFAALLLLLLAIAVLCWFYRDRLKEVNLLKYFDSSEQPEQSEQPAAEVKTGIAAVAEKYSLSLSESEAGATLSGNLKTRRERLSATAEAYEAMPGVSLDISDDESMRTSAEDALFTLTEGALKVAAATNRVVAIVGASPSPGALKKTLETLNADMPKLRGVDVTGVKFDAAVGREEPSDGSGGPGSAVASRAARPSKASKSSRSASPDLPVCGILTAPYPCLVMRDGRRVLEGATIGGSTIVEIRADSVVVTNSTGRFEWKP